MKLFQRTAVLVTTIGLLIAGASPVLADATVTFDAGAEGWIGPQGPGGSTGIEPAGGNPGANMHTVFNNFGITFRNDSNPEFIGDYTATPSVTLEIDVRVQSIAFFGSPVSRPWLVELRDYDDPEPGFPWTSVWFKFADIDESTHGEWTTFSVTIDDTSAAALPPGWGGTGAENEFAEPMLPPDRTFTSVLAGVDEIAFTTLEPGFAFGFTDFDLHIDNISISSAGAVPTVSQWGLIVLAAGLTAAAAVVMRRRSRLPAAC